MDTDASDVGLGAVLPQGGAGGKRLVAYYSRSLSRPEHNYCINRRELLAVVEVFKHFRPHLYSQRFLLRTDHASLTWLLSFKEPEGQVARWIEALQDSNFEVQNRAGRLHSDADALSRRPCEDSRHCERQEERDGATLQVAATGQVGPGEGWLTAMEDQEWQAAQDSDPTLARVGQWVDNQAVSALSVETKTYYSEWATLARRDGLLYRVWRAPGWRRDVWQLLVPKDWHQRVLHAVHGSVGAGHYGVAKTLNKLRQRFYWPGCRKDTELFVHCCDSCTAKKGPTGRSHAPLQQYQVGAPMERVGVDILGHSPSQTVGTTTSSWPWTISLSGRSCMRTPTRVR